LKPTQYVANFDSATAMLRALGRYLHGKDFPLTGALPASAEPLMKPVAAAINALPGRMRESVYTWSGRSEAIQPEKLGGVHAEEVARWMVSHYPRRPYPAVAIGSAGGALIHLCAALSIPWLPQTFLIPVRHPGLPVDEPRKDMEWGQKHAPALLEANPELRLHHMHDANQDRLMIQRMTYFRVKRLHLGETFLRFLEEVLPAGGTIFLVECERKWPTTKISERHVFQHGAPGGATEEEFIYGSQRVEDYLKRYGSPQRRWDSPEPDGERPEAEWGFEPELREDVGRLARNRGWRIRRVLFEEPEHLSPLVADLYRWWYRERGLPTDQLLVESFILTEPYWTLRTGSVPLWMTFNMEPSADFLERYLDGAHPYDQIRLMLFSHGVDSVGLAPIGRWQSILGRARKEGSFVGVDEQKFPRDFATFVRYHAELKKLTPRYPMPEPLALSQVDNFVKETGDRYLVRWA